MRMPSDKEANAPVFKIEPTLGEMAAQMGEATWSIPELSQREKVLVCIAADVCTSDIELPLEVEASNGHDRSIKDAATQDSETICEQLQMAQQLAKELT